MAFRLGVDVGGTFTDLFLVGDNGGGTQYRVKTPSTPADPSEGVLAGVRHYPGIGRASGDPALAVVSVAEGAKQLWTDDLVPFRGAVDSGVASGRDGRRGPLVSLYESL